MNSFRSEGEREIFEAAGMRVCLDLLFGSVQRANSGGNVLAVFFSGSRLSPR